MKIGHSKLIKSVAVSIGLLTAMSNTARADWHAFLRLDGVTGESQDTNHIGWMEVSINTAAHVEAQFSFIEGSGAIANYATAGSMDFTKLQGTATPMLFLNCAKGSAITTGTLDITPDNTVSSLLRLELTNVLVTTVKESSSSSTSGVVTDEFQLSALVFQWNYAVYNSSSGLPIYINNLLDFKNTRFDSGTNQPVFSMSGIRLASGVELNWNAAKGQTYRVYSVNQLGAPFVPVVEKTATNGSSMIINLPATNGTMFYLVEKTP